MKRNLSISRRDFLKGSAAATAAIAGLSLVGCDSTKVTETTTGSEMTTEATTQEAPVDHAEIVDICEGGEWLPASCWLNCGGGCPNFAYVKDGVVLRQKSDTTHEDTPDYPQQRSCPRGRSQSKVVFGADRLKYPMKRKHWEPFTGGDRSLRGKDEWVRISWEEALDLIAAELKHAKEDAGNESILVPSFGPYFSTFYKTLIGFGGYNNIRDTSSTGTYGIAAYHGADAHDMFTANDRFDMLNADTIVLYACNPSWASMGNPTSYFLRAKEAGVKFIFVGPTYNETAARMNATWIQVRPGTDTAFMLAVAYEMVRMDAEKKLIDWDFLKKCTVGFDETMMPADAKLNENFKGYLLGEYDGVPKTPEWATEICGTPVEKITWYAEQLGKDNKVHLLHSFAAARNNGAENVPQLFMTLGAMGGHMGKEGHACGSAYHRNAGNDSGFSTILTNTYGLGNYAYVGSNTVPYVLAAPTAWRDIVAGKTKYMYDWNNNLLAQPVEKDLKINVMYNCWRNPMQTIPAIGTLMKALEKIPTVITQAFSLNFTAEYSDIVLPISTMWERMADTFYRGWGCREYQPFPVKLIEPLYESWSDEQIGYELAKKLGLDADALYPINEEQDYFNTIVGATVVEEDGVTYGPLVTVTADDVTAMKEKYGVDIAPQEGKINIQDLLFKQGMYSVERKLGDNFGGIKYKAFVEDPENNPRPTPSGKFEIYCQTKADAINALGEGEIKPYPNYILPVNGYESTFSDWENKVKGEYPFQIYNPHYIRRAHTGFDNIAQLREIAPNPVFLNASDAAAKGIQEGDFVKIWNKFGTVIRQASLTERTMPGCVGLPHGTWTRFNEEGFDYSGSDNVICAPETQLIQTSGYNTNICNYEKYEGTLEPDYTWPQKIVEF